MKLDLNVLFLIAAGFIAGLLDWLICRILISGNQIRKSIQSSTTKPAIEFSQQAMNAVTFELAAQFH